MCFFFSSRRRHTRCAVVTGVQTCALPISSPLLNDLMDVDDESYALCVEALGAVDLRARVRDLVMPFHVIAGAVDPVIPLDAAEEAEIGRAQCRERVCQYV